MTSDEHASDVIRQARTSAGLSQVALAALIGTTQSAVSRWERAHDEPRLSTLRRIVAACGQRLVIATEPADSSGDDEVDLAQIRQQLALSPVERLAGVSNLGRVLATARRLA